jgi:hypothetical protein
MFSVRIPHFPLFTSVLIHGTPPQISLVLSNWAYLYLGVAFIHMLKAFSPVAILLAAFAFRTKNFSLKLCAIVLVISSGVGLASYGESKFNLTGVIIQVGRGCFAPPLSSRPLICPLDGRHRHRSNSSDAHSASAAIGQRDVTAQNALL